MWVALDEQGSASSLFQRPWCGDSQSSRRWDWSWSASPRGVRRRRSYNRDALFFMEVRSSLFASVLTVFVLLAGPTSADDSGSGDGMAIAGGGKDCEGRPSAIRLIVNVSQLR